MCSVVFNTMRSKLIKNGGVSLCLVFWNEKMSETIKQMMAKNGYKKQNFIKLQLNNFSTNSCKGTNTRRIDYFFTMKVSLLLNTNIQL
jgi:hypothetical protein